MPTRRVHRRIPVFDRSRARLALAVVAASLLVHGCVKANPPTDVSNPVAPSSSSGPSTPAPNPATGPLAYTQDLKPIFDSDCVVCHSASRPSAGYSMATYAAVMRDVVAGNANSRLVIWTQPGGSMYRFFSGDRAGRAAMVRSWVVDDKAAQSR